MAFKVAIYSLTRDRLDYTKHCFGLLRDLAGYPFDHYVIDNGSQDGTVEWLKDEYKPYQLVENPINYGIPIASNQALDAIGNDYDLIIKMDNDCEVVYPNLLRRIVRLYENTPPLKNLFLSPRVEGIVNQPKRYAKTMVDDVEIGLTGIIGGLFHVMRADIYQTFRYDESLPMARGSDDKVSTWFRRQGGECGYMEPLEVRHYETTAGQAARYPEYFERKQKEEHEAFKPS